MLSEHNLDVTESFYRDIPLPSYSMLSSIASNGVEVVTGEKNSNLVLKFGSLVDDMCYMPHIVEDKYYHGKVEKPPTGNVKKIIDNVVGRLYSQTHNPYKINTKKPSSRLSSHKDMLLLEAQSLGVYKSYSDDKIMDSLKKGSKYFRDKIESWGKIHIPSEMWDLAVVTVSTLQNNQFTSKYFVQKEDTTELLFQFKFQNKVYGREVKGMLDCVHVDHIKKEITPVDLKTGENPVHNFKMSFLSYGYYIQASLYRDALINIVNNDPMLAGYTVNEFRFVYISKLNPYKPLIFVVPPNLHRAGLRGFTDSFGFYRKGVYELLEEYYDCVENNNCLYTKEEIENKGLIYLNDVLNNAEKN